MVRQKIAREAVKVLNDDSEWLAESQHEGSHIHVFSLDITWTVLPSSHATHIITVEDQDLAIGSVNVSPPAIALEVPANSTVSYTSPFQSLTIHRQQSKNCVGYKIAMTNTGRHNPSDNPCLRHLTHQHQSHTDGGANYPDVTDRWLSNRWKAMPKFLRYALVTFAALVVLVPLLLWLLRALNLLSYPPVQSRSGGVFYVDPVKGNDLANGGQLTPFKTMSYAFQQAKPGDIIYLAAGEYLNLNPIMIPTGIGVVVPAHTVFSGNPSPPSNPPSPSNTPSLWTSDSPFKDLSPNHWATPFIQALAQQGIVVGFEDGTFQPDARINRAQYAALLNKIFILTEKRPTTRFQDVSPDFWADQIIQKAYRSEFLIGFPDNMFKPNENVQRVQVIASLVNGLGIAIGDDQVLNFYTDRDRIPEWAKAQVAAATQERLVVNYPTPQQLNPTEGATRAEVAAMIYQALVYQKWLTPIESIHIVRQ